MNYFQLPNIYKLQKLNTSANVISHRSHSDNKTMFNFHSNTCSFEKDELFIALGSLFGHSKVLKINTNNQFYEHDFRELSDLRVSNNIKDDSLVFSFYVGNNPSCIFLTGNFTTSWMDLLTLPTKVDTKISMKPYLVHSFRKNNYIIASKDLLNEAALCLLPTNLIRKMKKLRERDVMLYNLQTDTPKVFNLDTKVYSVSIGDNIAAAVTSSKVFFFDLD